MPSNPDKRFAVGDIVQHFKRKADATDNSYLYEIKGFATHTETGETLVIYQALYGDHILYARPETMFCEKTDKEKYPMATQEYRFEKIAAR